MLNQWPQHQSVLLQVFILLLLFLSLPAAWLTAAGRPGPARLGLSRLGSARPTDTMTYIQQLQAAAAAAQASLTSPSVRSLSITLGSISSKYWSGGFSYLSVKSAALYCPDFFSWSSSSSSPLSLLLLCGSSSPPPPPPPLPPLRLMYQQIFNLLSIKNALEVSVCSLFAFNNSGSTQGAGGGARCSAQPQWSPVNERHFR